VPKHSILMDITTRIPVHYANMRSACHRPLGRNGTFSRGTSKSFTTIQIEELESKVANPMNFSKHQILSTGKMLKSRNKIIAGDDSDQGGTSTSSESGEELWLKKEK